MPAHVFEFDVATDCPDGKVNPGTLEGEIRTAITSDLITKGLGGVVVDGGVVSNGGTVTGGTLKITFMELLPPEQETILHGDADSPAGGLIAAHDNSPVLTTEIEAIVTNRVTTTSRRPSGAEHDRVYAFSVNFCDRSTWFHDSLAAQDEFTVVDNPRSTFQLSHGTESSSPDAENEAIIDLSHGKVGDENDITDPQGRYRAMGHGYVSPSPTDPFCYWGDYQGGVKGDLSGYVPVVTVDGVEAIERAFDKDTSSGDYEIDYTTGLLTFYEPIDVGKVVAVDYYYADSTCAARVLVEPSPGTTYAIEKVEIQTTADVVPTSDMVSTVLISTNVYRAQGLVFFPPDEHVQARRPTVLKTMQDVHNWAHVVHPEGPAHAVGRPRGLQSPIRVHEVKYLSEIPVYGDFGAKLYFTLGENKPFEGTWASIVVYGITDVA